MKTVIILGTSRVDGNTSQLVDAFKRNSTADVLNLVDYSISSFDYGHSNANDDFVSFIDQVLTYDHIIFATPVYWYSMSSQMKTFFDRMSDLVTVEKDRGRKLRGKLCSLIATGYDNSPADCFEKPFTLSADYLGMVYKGMLYCACQDTFIESEHKENMADFIECNVT